MTRASLQLKVPAGDVLLGARMTIHVATQLQRNRGAVVPPTIVVLETKVESEPDEQGEVTVVVQYNELSDGREHLRPSLDPDVEEALKLKGPRDDRQDPAGRFRRNRNASVGWRQDTNNPDNDE